METLEAIYKALADELEKIGKRRDELVFSSGKVSADVMIIGEAPGKDEVEQKAPFVGKAGKNLDEFLRISGISRDELFITNTVKFRPYRTGATGRKSNRPPDAGEIAACLPCLKKEIAIVRPKWIVTLGNTALRALLTGKETIGACHGTVIAFGDARLYPLYHPASIIYRPELKEVYGHDVRRLKEFLGGNEQG